MSPKIQSYKSVLEKRLCFRFLLQANTPGIFSLVNEKNKCVFVIASSNPIKSLGNIVSELASNVHSNKKLRRDKNLLRLKFEKSCPKKHLMAEKLECIANWKLQGYSIYNTEVLPMYRPIVGINENQLLQVSLLTKGKRVYPIKEFTNHDDVATFIGKTTVYDMLRMIS